MATLQLDYSSDEDERASASGDAFAISSIKPAKRQRVEGAHRIEAAPHVLSEVSQPEFVALACMSNILLGPSETDVSHQYVSLLSIFRPLLTTSSKQRVQRIPR